MKKELKLLHFGDLHEDHKVPSSRLDDFHATRDKKIEEIIRIGEEEDVIAFTQPGDFLHRHNIPSTYLSKIINQWGKNNVDINAIIDGIKLGSHTNEDLIKAVEEINKKPIIGTIGNHEVLGESISEYNGSSLNSLVLSSFMQLATKEKPIMLKTDFGKTVAITASTYVHDIDGEDKSHYIIEEKLGDYHIHIVHGMLMDKSVGSKFAHTVVDEIAYRTKADLTIAGHNHIGFNEIEIDGKLFVNPGSPTRLSAEKKEIARMPKVMIIAISEKGISLKYRYLESAKKGDEVLSRDHIIAKNDKKDKMKEITKLIKDANVERGLDIQEIIQKIAENEHLDKLVVDETIKRLKEQVKLMTSDYVPSGKYHITGLSLENFECHENSSFEFVNGCNILAGESRNGKSSVIRAIREVMLCFMKDPRTSIRHGKDYFKITLYTSHGYIIERIVERKKEAAIGENGKKTRGKTPKNGFNIYNPNTGEYTYSNTKAIKEVQSILGYCEMELDAKNKIGMNFMNQGEGWFFLGKSMSSLDKAKVLGLPFGTQHADAVLKSINAEAKKHNIEITKMNNEIAELQEEINSFEYLEYLEAEIEKGEEKIIELEKELSNIESIGNIIVDLEKIGNAKSILDRNEEILKSNETIIKDILNNLINTNEDIKKIDTLIVDIDKFNNSILCLNKLSNQLIIPTDFTSTISSLKDCNFEINEMERKLEMFFKLEQNIKDIENSINVLNCMMKVLPKNNVDFNGLKNKANEVLAEEESIKKYNKINEEKLKITKAIGYLEQSKKFIEIDISNRIDKCRDIYNNVLQIHKTTSEVTNLFEQLKENQKELDNKTNDLNLKIKNYKDFLAQVDVCPVCKAKLTMDKIDEMTVTII